MMFYLFALIVKTFVLFNLNFDLAYKSLYITLTLTLIQIIANSKLIRQWAVRVYTQRLYIVTIHIVCLEG